MFRFPWGDMHSLNLGWFLQKFNELRADWATAEENITGALDAEIQRAEDALSDVFDARDAAAASATAAAGSASSAGTSATAAQNSATAAGNSATLANNKATAAGLSEAAAAQSATQAGNSATAAAGSATTASNAATNAAASETAAGQSATAAAGSATAAGNSATAAAGSATAAAQSATEIEASAEQIDQNAADIIALQTGTSALVSYTAEDVIITARYWKVGNVVKLSGNFYFPTNERPQPVPLPANAPNPISTTGEDVGIWVHPDLVPGIIFLNHTNKTITFNFGKFTDTSTSSRARFEIVYISE